MPGKQWEMSSERVTWAGGRGPAWAPTRLGVLGSLRQLNLIQLQPLLVILVVVLDLSLLLGRNLLGQCVPIHTMHLNQQQ